MRRDDGSYSCLPLHRQTEKYDLHDAFSMPDIAISSGTENTSLALIKRRPWSAKRSAPKRAVNDQFRGLGANEKARYRLILAKWFEFGPHCAFLQLSRAFHEGETECGAGDAPMPRLPRNCKRLFSIQPSHWTCPGRRITRRPRARRPAADGITRSRRVDGRGIMGFGICCQFAAIVALVCCHGFARAQSSPDQIPPCGQFGPPATSRKFADRPARPAER